MFLLDHLHRAPSYKPAPRSRAVVGYFFPDAPEREDDWQVVPALDALGRTMEGGLYPAPVNALTPKMRALALWVHDGIFRESFAGPLMRPLRDTYLLPEDRLRVQASHRHAGTGHIGVEDNLQVPARSWYIQWLVVNRILPQICAPQVMDWITAHGAPLYQALQAGTGLSGGGGTRPVPLEFTTLGALVAPRLMPDSRSQMLANELDRSLLQRDPAPQDNPHALALRRSYLLNIPSAQDCIGALNQRLALKLPVLTGEALAMGAQHRALNLGDLTRATPLYYYIRREAAVLQGGRRFGPLGSHIIGQTLLGLLQGDPDSYLHQSGSDNGRWCPEDAPELQVDRIA